MSFFNFFDRGSKEVVNEFEQSRKTKGGKLFKVINTICILGMFVALGIGVLGICRVLKFNAATFGIIGTIASVCIGSWLMLPWVAYLDQKKHKKLSITFIGLDIVVPLLWIIAVWFLVIKVTAGTVGAGTLTFIKSVFLISMQFSVVSLIANTILRYGKRLIIVQIVAYLSYIYFDFYISYAVFCISFNAADGIVFSGALHILGNKVLVSLFVLSLVYVSVAFSIINVGNRNRRGRRLGDSATDMLPEDQIDYHEPVVVKKESLEEQLEALQNLLDKGLITQEEFDEKRKEIINRY